jgi:toxin ParE1/3/4
VGARVTWSLKAELELAEIRDYIERDSKANAVQVVEQLLDAVDRLSIYPLSGHIITKWKNPARRDLVVGSYRLMYEISSGEIIIFGVQRTRRRIPKRFRNEWLK